MTLLRLMVLFIVMVFATGCASFPLDRLANEALQGTVNFGHDFLSGTSEMVGAFVEAVPAAANVKVHCPTIPWRHELSQQGKQPKPDSVASARLASMMSRERSSIECLAIAEQAYREFNYTKAVQHASDAVLFTGNVTEQGQAYVICGASFYLLNDDDKARVNFTAAKQCGVVSLDPKIYPEEMREFFKNYR